MVICWFGLVVWDSKGAFHPNQHVIINVDVAIKFSHVFGKFERKSAVVCSRFPKMIKQQIVGFIDDVPHLYPIQMKTWGPGWYRNSWGSWGKVIGENIGGASWEKGPLNSQPHISGYLVGITIFTMTFREEKYTHCPYCSQSRIHKDMGMVWEYHGSSLPEGGLTIGSLWNHPWFVEELMVWQNVSWRLWPASVWMSFWPRRCDNEERRAAVGCRWYGRVAANDSLRT